MADLKADIGVVGLAVMGANLALNFANHGFAAAVFNRTASKTDEFLAGPAKGKNIVGFHSMAEFVGALARPRKIMLMVKAGEPVDQTLNELVGLLEVGDIVMDGGNSFYLDTARRAQELGRRGLLYLGVGISGGEEGALNGPSLMPGGDIAAWKVVEPLLTAIAAKVDSVPCCSWIGPEGAGHFVKMVHNGIEYADMQLIAEGYGYLRDRIGWKNSRIADQIDEWRKGPLGGYLMDITSVILREKDPESGILLLDRILDIPGQKGTGRWTAEAALRYGAPAQTLLFAVQQRSLDSNKELRVRAAKKLPAPEAEAFADDEDRDDMAGTLEGALYCGKICAYAQGFALMRAAAQSAGWTLDFGKIALLWRGGCIIRAKFLDRIAEAFERDSGLENLLFDRFFRSALAEYQESWRVVAADAVLSGCSLPGVVSSLAFFDALRDEDSPANLIQAQRDYFGAHTFERTDRPRGTFFHHQWKPF